MTSAFVRKCCFLLTRNKREEDVKSDQFETVTFRWEKITVLGCCFPVCTPAEAHWLME